MLSNLSDDILLNTLDEVTMHNHFYSSIVILTDMKITTYKKNSSVGYSTNHISNNNDNIYRSKNKNYLLTLSINDEKYNQQTGSDTLMLCYGDSLVESLQSRLEKGMIILLHNFILKPQKINEKYPNVNDSRILSLADETVIHVLRDCKGEKYFIHPHAFPLLHQKIKLIERHFNGLLQSFRYSDYVSIFIR